LITFGFTAARFVFAEMAEGNNANKENNENAFRIGLKK